MIAWILGIAFVLFILDLVFTGGKTIRKDFSELFTMFIGVLMIVMFFKWLFSK